MVFNSYSFLLFFPIVLVLTQLAPAKWRNGLLLVASYVFYASWGTHFCVLLLGLTVLVYAAGLLLGQKKRRWLFWLGLGGTLGALLVYKYLDFGLYSINALTRALGLGEPMPRVSLLQPAGISFFTFQAAGYLIDVYRGKYKPEKNFLRFALFVSFFPQLVAGPIVLYSEMIPQFKDPRRRYWNWDNAAAGAYIFTVGLFKKAVIADTLALFVDTGFGAASLGFCAAWATALSYTFQVYFDFSGYSDMAVGLGKLFNIDIPFNFRSPYRSESIGVFWRRWHITLGRALQSYVYFPLGGSRAGKLRTYRNLLITFLVSGLWHGAAWTFVLWGLLHGLFNALERIFAKPLSRVPHWVRVGCTFLIVNALWVLFRAESFQSAATVYRGMVDFSNLAFAQVGSLAVDGFVGVPNRLNAIYVVGILAALAVVCFRCKNSCQMLTEFTCRKGALWATAVFFCIALVHLSRESVFIYFNF